MQVQSRSSAGPKGQLKSPCRLQMALVTVDGSGDNIQYDAATICSQAMPVTPAQPSTGLGSYVAQLLLGHPCWHAADQALPQLCNSSVAARAQAAARSAASKPSVPP